MFVICWWFVLWFVGGVVVGRWSVFCFPLRWLCNCFVVCLVICCSSLEVWLRCVCVCFVKVCMISFVVRRAVVVLWRLWLLCFVTRLCCVCDSLVVIYFWFIDDFVCDCLVVFVVWLFGDCFLILLAAASLALLWFTCDSLVACLCFVGVPCWLFLWTLFSFRDVWWLLVIVVWLVGSFSCVVCWWSVGGSLVVCFCDVVCVVCDSMAIVFCDSFDEVVVLFDPGVSVW